MSKYRKEVLTILKPDEIKSTNELLQDLEKKTGKVINWHLLYRVLRDLSEEGKIEKLKAKAGFFWRKK
jgi:Fe2+ or Zn2+ uptake regulation protein